MSIIGYVQHHVHSTPLVMMILAFQESIHYGCTINGVKRVTVLYVGNANIVHIDISTLNKVCNMLGKVDTHKYDKIDGLSG